MASPTEGHPALIEDYFRRIESLVADAGIVRFFNITYDKRSASIGFIRGSIYFLDGSLLHLREFVDVEYGSERYMYAYHYQRLDGTLVFRYDNTPHFPYLPTFPHHKHEGSESHIVAAGSADLEIVLAEIRGLMSPQEP
jgi:Family of unknown function (DUF6516)